jgi:hypothetical protein
MNHPACSPRSNVSTASPSGKPGARGSSTTARRSRGDPGRRWPHMSISAMDTDRSGATTGGSARAPVHRGGTRVFRGSTERLPRLRPLRRDDSPETTGCARWRCAPFSPSLCCRKPTAAHATLPSTCEEAVRAPVLPMCGERLVQSVRTDFALGDAIEMFAARHGRFNDEVRGDEPELAAKLRLRTASSRQAG